MKKLLLLGLISCMSLIGFTSANSIDNFTSDSNIVSVNFEGDYYLGDLDYDSLGDTSINFAYFCVDTLYRDYNISFYSNDDSVSYENISTNPYCSSVYTDLGDNSLQIYFEDNYELQVSGKLYFSYSPITYNSSSEGGAEGGNNGGGIVDGNNGGILSGGSSAFNGLLGSVGNTIQEFIPYVIQISLGIIMAIIGFVAIKRLMYWIRAKVLGTFSSGKRR